jgi:hypothetical protein
MRRKKNDLDNLDAVGTSNYGSGFSSYEKIKERSK